MIEKMDDWVWFALLFAAGFIAYSVFGMQISIMRKCGRRVYWLLSGGEAFDGDENALEAILYFAELVPDGH